MALLTTGEKAPPIEALDQSGRLFSLSELLGKKVILFFYSEAGSPTCTTVACNLRDDYALLQKHGFAVVGISPDEVQKQAKFTAKQNLPYTLLADPDRRIIESYGVWGPKKMMGREYEGVLRTTYVIDEQGTIERVIPKVISKKHAEQILATYA